MSRFTVGENAIITKGVYKGALVEIVSTTAELNVIFAEECYTAVLLEPFSFTLPSSTKVFSAEPGAEIWAESSELIEATELSKALYRKNVTRLRCCINVNKKNKPGS